jgi:hypothetical protein
MSAETDLVSGQGDTADLVAGIGDNYTPNQTPFDVADNGLVSTSGNSASSSAPSWLSGLQGLVTTGSSIYGTVSQAVNGKPGTPISKAPAGPNQTTTTPAASNPSSKSLWLIAGAAVLAVVLFVVLGRK